MNSKSKIIIRKKFNKLKNKKIKIFESKHLNINSGKVKKILKWKLQINNIECNRSYYRMVFNF